MSEGAIRRYLQNIGVATEFTGVFKSFTKGFIGFSFQNISLHTFKHLFKFMVIWSAAQL